VGKIDCIGADYQFISTVALKTVQFMTDYRTEAIPGVPSQPSHSEDAAFAHLQRIDMTETAAKIDAVYKNFVLATVNNHCVRMAVMQGEYRWHQHPRSDECFLVLEGLLEIDLANGKTTVLRPGEAFTIPAGVVHRTRSRERSVNLCFENLEAYTDVVFVDEPSR
jgi:mannose-6-phosphate isomerase-like protein (cupin superfamily)